MRPSPTPGGPLARRERAFVPNGQTVFHPMSMDLPDLLEPERIRCRCDIHSKKRALQTLAELLGASLRRAAGTDDGGDPDGAAPDAAGAGAAAGGASSGAGGGGHAANASDAADDATDDEPPTRVANLELATKRERGGRKGSGRSSGRSASRAADEETETGDISDMAILDALIARERLGSTGLGHGVALPHSRLELVDTPLAAMITLNEGVDFEAGDGEPVDLVLGLLVPQDCNDEHLKILANLARRFSDAGFREALREQDSGEALFEHLQRLAADT